MMENKLSAVRYLNNNCGICDYNGLEILTFWSENTVLGSGCKKGYVISFLKVLLAYLGITAAAVCTAQRPVELSENILQNLFHNLTPQTVVIRESMALKRLKCPLRRPTWTPWSGTRWRARWRTKTTSSSSMPARGEQGRGWGFRQNVFIHFNLDVCCQSDWKGRVGEDTFEMYLRYRYRYMKGCIFCIF